jgi:cytochrome c553
LAKFEPAFKPSSALSSFLRAANIRCLTNAMQLSSRFIRVPLSLRITFLALLLVAGGLILSGCRSASADVTARGRELFETCVPCHNADGSGNAAVGAPNIAGMKQWYVEAELKKFRSGARGMQFSDLEGMRMRPMSLSLNSDDDVQAVARYVESLPVVRHAALLQGDVHAGEERFRAVCSSCHGDNGQGIDDVKAPRLAGVDDWYLATELRKFKAGVRGNNPKDIEGRLMRPMARGLADEDAIRNVVAYIDTLKQ